MTSPALYTQTKCNINGKEQPGKVIAVATYFDHRKVCFLTEGQAIGEWVSESALIPNWSPSEQLTKDIKPYMPANKATTFEVKQDIPNAEKEAKTEAEQDIHALAKFVSDTQKAIHNKTAQDIQTVFKLFAEAQSAIEQKIQATVQSLQDADRQAREWLNQAIKGIGEHVVSPLIKSFTDYGKLFLDTIVKIINNVDVNKAKEAVKQIKKKYPHEQPRQIANRLIQEKAIFATINAYTGVRRKTLNSLLEMVCQIAICYGFEELDSPEKKGEILIIYLIVFSINQLRKRVLEFLEACTTISAKVLDPATTLILFQAVGYAAREFYEAKSKAKPLVELGKKVEAYLEEAISEMVAVEEVVAQAVSMKEQLVLS